MNQTAPGVWRFVIPAGSGRAYRWAQLDDYLHLKRSGFQWQPPLRLSLRARCSAQEHAGTWGFGLWNDPFSMGMGVQGSAARLPVLPNTAWFFFASAHNHLTFRDDTPGSGMLAGVFSSWRVSPARVILAGAALPLALFRRTASIPRRMLRRLIDESALQLQGDWTDWHDYEIDIQPAGVTFWLDGRICHQSGLAPCGRLGLVIWIDNQYARFAAGEHLRIGTLPADAEQWLEIRDLAISSD